MDANAIMSALAQYGALGGIVCWFAFRMEKRLDRHSAIIDDLVRVQALQVLAGGASVLVKEQADQILQSVNLRTHNKL